MKNALTCLLIGSLLSLPVMAGSATPPSNVTHKPASLTQETLRQLTPNAELKRLMRGNARFVSGKLYEYPLLTQAKTTSLHGQFPASVILSCMDSRTSPELIFNQGLGDIFSIRVAGNVVDTDQIGSMEYAVKVVGSKLIVVMGHTQCGAIKGACHHEQLGNLTALLKKIQPAVSKVEAASHATMNCDEAKTLHDIAKQNVIDMLQQINDKSPVIRDLVNKRQIAVVGAMHDLRTGKVVFFDSDGKQLN